MSWRIEESINKNEAFYIIGIKDDGRPIGIPPDEFNSSIETISKMCKKLDVEYEIIRVANGEMENCLVGEIRITKKCIKKEIISDIHLAVMGNVDSGKSTLVGVLKNGVLDNGNGSARSCVFKYPHEIDTGRTSSICKHIIGFNDKGKQIKGLDYGDNIDDLHKVITLVDLAGHEKYLKTTTEGLSGENIDYSMVLVGGNMGVQRMTKEHVGLLMAFNIPFFIVTTKTDMSPPQILKETITNIKKIIKGRGINLVPYPVRDSSCINIAIEGMINKTLVPMIKVSNVNGNGMDILLKFIHELPENKIWKENAKKSTLLRIDETYSVPGIGTVLGGNIVNGSLKVGKKMKIGPFNGEFRDVTIKSLFYLGNPCDECFAGQSVSITIKSMKGEKLKRENIRHGTVLCDANPLPEATFYFEADLTILHHPTTISLKYEPVVHIGTVIQTCNIVKMSKDVLRSGDKATCIFKFKYHPEYINIGNTIVFREGITHGIGNVTKILTADIINVNEIKEITLHEITNNRKIADERIKQSFIKN